jgi:hypothetical protein
MLPLVRTVDQRLEGMLRALQSGQDTVSAHRSQLTPCLKKKTASSPVARVVFSDDGQWLAYWELDQHGVHIIKLSSGTAAENEQYVDFDAAIQCIAFGPNSKHLCVGLKSETNVLGKFEVLKHGDNESFTICRTILLTEVPATAVTGDGGSKALWMGNTFAFVYGDQLYLVNVCSFTMPDRNGKMYLSRQVCKECKYDFAICSNIKRYYDRVVCLNISNIRIYESILNSEGYIQIYHNQTIDISPVAKELNPRITMSRNYIVVYTPTTQLFAVYRPLDSNDLGYEIRQSNWAWYIDVHVPHNDLFFKEDSLSVLYIVQQNQISKTDLTFKAPKNWFADLPPPEIEPDKDFQVEGNVTRAVYTPGLLGVCSSEAMTVFKM